MGTKSNPENFVSSVISSNTNTFSSSNYQYINPGRNQHHSVLNITGRLGEKPSTYEENKHKLPMQLSRQPTSGSVGVSVITPAISINKSSHKETHYKQQYPHPHHNYHQQQQHQHVPKIQTVRNSGDNYNRTNAYSNAGKLVPPPSTNVSVTAINNSFMPSKSKIVGSVSTPTASVVYSHTQHFPKFISGSRFLVNTEKGDVYLGEDGGLTEIPDQRAQYSNHMPPDYQYVLQDHSYSQLPESPPPPPIPQTPTHQRTTINGLSRITSSSVTPTKVTLNNNRIVTVGNVAGSLTNNVISNRLNNQLAQSNSSMNNYSTVSAIVNSVATNIQNNNGTSVIAVNPKRNVHTNLTVVTNLSNVSKSLLLTGNIGDKLEESDLSEDDRIPDPHGEETETAPEAEEAENEEESVTRCICNFQHDDGYMICCDKCLAWQHIACMGIDRYQIPDEYQCEKCQPRYIDKKKAVELQKKKIAEKLCVGVNYDSDSSDNPVPSSRGNKNQAKRKYKGRRIGNKRKGIRVKDKDIKPKKNVGNSKRRQIKNSVGLHPSSPSSPSLSSSTTNLTAEKKKRLLERKQMLLKKQITNKRTVRKQAQNTKRLVDRGKPEDEFEHRTVSSCTNDEDTDHNIYQVREWVDRYEEAVTNHYSQELRARLMGVQMNGVCTTTLRSEKCRSSLLQNGEKVVVATCNLSSNNAIIELRGKYMWTGAESFKQNNISPSTPRVFYYKLPRQDKQDKQETEICVDCRTYGNFARFVRRSCKPNSELRHCFRKTSIHLYIHAAQTIKKNSEILIGHYGPETASSCVCGSPETCTAAKVPNSYTLRYADKKESQSVRSSSPSENTKIKKTIMNSEKQKKKVKEDKKLTKEKRRGRRRSPSSASNSDQESSSRDHSPSTPTKLTVSMWGKPTANINMNLDTAKVNVENEKHEKPSTNIEKTCSTVVTTSTTTTVNSTTSCTKSISNITTITNTMTSNASTPAISVISSDLTSSTNTNNSSSTKQNTRTTRQSEYARKEKQQLDMPLFFSEPKNHKMTREEKKIQAYMKAFEAMEKSEARKQESQKQRRESTSETESSGKKGICRKSVKSRKITDESKEDKHDDEIKSRSRKTSQNEDEVDNKPTATIKEEPKCENSPSSNKDSSEDAENNSKIIITEAKEDCENDEINNVESDLAKFLPLPISPKVNNKVINEKPEPSECDESSDTPVKRKRNGSMIANKLNKQRQACTKRSRLSRPMAKRTATRARILKDKKKKSESGEANGSAETRTCDVSERTRRAVQRQKKTVTTGKLQKDDTFQNERKNTANYSPGKFRKTEDHQLGSPYSTPPKSRERLDSSSSSGGTPPTPVSDTCLLVAAAVGHLTDFKFPNTKKELMNAWFKEEKKPPDDDGSSKLAQEGNNEYAKKRWLRQAISEEGDSSIPRPEGALSPNGEYGGPLKKRRFARESISQDSSCSPTGNSFINANQMSFDDDDDIPSPDASLFRASDGDDVTTYHSTQPQTKNDAKLDESENIHSESNEGTLPTTKLEKEEKYSVNISEENNALSTVVKTVDTVVSLTDSVTSPVKERDKITQEICSPSVSKKKLSLTEYQQRKNVNTVVTTESTGDVVQEVPALAEAPSPTIESADTIGRSSSRSSITSSSCSEEEDNSHVASAQVIARSLMIESRHLSYGPQASALFNSIRSGSIGQTGPQTFNTKTNAPNPPLPRENLAERLKHEFGVHVQEDENEKNLNVLQSALSSVKIPEVSVQPSEVSNSQKEMHLRLKKVQPPPPPPPLPAGPPPALPPLPDVPHLFAPSYYPYPITGVRPAFFVAPPPPPPPPPLGPPPVPPPPVPPPTLPPGPPPPPPPPE